MKIPFGKEQDGYDIAVNYLMPAAARPAIIGQMIQEHIDYMLSKSPLISLWSFRRKGYIVAPFWSKLWARRIALFQSVA